MIERAIHQEIPVRKIIFEIREFTRINRENNPFQYSLKL